MPTDSRTVAAYCANSRGAETSSATVDFGCVSPDPEDCAIKLTRLSFRSRNLSVSIIKFSRSVAPGFYMAPDSQSLANLMHRSGGRDEVVRLVRPQISAGWNRSLFFASPFANQELSSACNVCGVAGRHPTSEQKPCTLRTRSESTPAALSSTRSCCTAVNSLLQRSQLVAFSLFKFKLWSVYAPTGFIS